MQKIIEEFRKKGISKEDEKILLEFSGDDFSKYRRFA